MGCFVFKRVQAFYFPRSLDQIIERDNEVCTIDLFVKAIHLTSLNFRIKESKEGSLFIIPGLADALRVMHRAIH